MSNFEKMSFRNGINRLHSSPFKLLDFEMLVLENGDKYEAVTGDREILADILSGKANFNINGEKFTNIGGRQNPFGGKPYSVYLPCGANYTIEAIGHLEIGLISAPSDLDIPAYVIGPDKVTSGVWGAANFSRDYHQILTLAGQPNLPAKRLIVGETYTWPGNWSTYPPHKHETDNLPREAFHEELYFFKLNPPDGFAMIRHYSDDFDGGYTISDNSIWLGDKGYHTVASAPGITTFYIWALAGNQRVQATAEDPTTSWVGRAQPMLKALGH